ncbi:hypothetical protein MVEN_01794200 [Mycena venus]|uniref:Uncharacterized protein n=1 Tax=Mycena venus TaxID=2733690 RepID=A0A8H7CLF9_9AGAR|nr:hypothetical protein MVEN_01794200 [Mycena venus]
MLSQKNKMPDLLVQLLPLALTPLAALVPNGIQRCVILAFAALYFGGFVVLPNLPSVRFKKLEQFIDETVKIHATAIRELDKNPRFVTESSLRVAQIQLSESILRTRILSCKDIAWKKYVQHLRSLSMQIGVCHRDVKEIRTSLLMALECNRQRRYTEDIAQRRTTLDTAFLNPAENSFMDV